MSYDSIGISVPDIVVLLGLHMGLNFKRYYYFSSRILPPQKKTIFHPIFYGLL